MEGSSQVGNGETVSAPSAEWRLSRTTERESLGYRRAVKSRRVSGWFLGLVVLSSCPAMLVQFLAGADGGSWPLGLVVVLFVLGAAAHGQTGQRLAEGLRRREAFRSDHDGVAGWLVELVVLQGAAPTGRDTGVVWFDDDRLYFVGNRASFGLARDQVSSARYDDWLPNDLSPALMIVLDWETPAGKPGVGFNVLPQAVGEFRANRTGPALSAAVRGWMGASRGDGGQLPPLSIGLDAPSAFSLLSGALQSTAVWGVVVSLVLWTSAATTWWLAPVWAIVAMLLLIPWSQVWIPRLRWRAWRDRRRLDRSASQ